MDMLTRDMMTELSTSCALRWLRRCSQRYARMVASPASASPIEEYTGDREIESSRLTSRTDACSGMHNPSSQPCRRLADQGVHQGARNGVQALDLAHGRLFRHAHP